MSVARPDRRAGLSAASSILILLGLALALATLPAACARNPVSGKPDAVLMSEEGEIAQGREAAKQVAEQMGLVEDPELKAYVDALGQRLAKHSPRENLQYEFHIVDMPEPNAFALPGGYIYVSRGLLAYVNSEDELANVIGHEIGHVAARHSVTRQAANAPLIPIRIAAGIGGAAVSIVSPTLGNLIVGTGNLPGSFALAAYGRDQEREADRLGQELAAKSGWNPTAIASFMDTLTSEDKLAGNDPNRTSFFQSHPATPERSANGRKFAKTLTITKQARVTATQREFLDKLDGIVVGEGAVGGVFIDNKFIQPDLGFALTFPAGWETANTPQAVLAQAGDQTAQLILELAGEGDDPFEAANAFSRKQRLETGPKALQLHGLKAVEATAEIGSWRNKTKLQITWIASNGLVYRILGLAQPDAYERWQSELASTAKSFHVPDEAELGEVRENRLRIEKTREGESIVKLIERTGAKWTAEQAAVANALDPEAALAGGLLIKVSKAEPYSPKAR